MGNIQIKTDEIEPNVRWKHICIKLTKDGLIDLGVLENWTLAEIRRFYEKFRELCGKEIYRFVSKRAFIELYGSKQANSGLIFDLFDYKAKGRINMFHFIAVLIWTSYTNKDKKILFCFNLFDFDNNGTISYEEMIYIFYATCKGFAAFSNTPIPSKRDMLLIAKKTFHTADLNADHMLELKEIEAWMDTNPEFLNLLEKYEPSIVVKDDGGVFENFPIIDIKSFSKTILHIEIDIAQYGKDTVSSLKKKRNPVVPPKKREHEDAFRYMCAKKELTKCIGQKRNTYQLNIVHRNYDKIKEVKMLISKINLATLRKRELSLKNIPPHLHLSNRKQKVIYPSIKPQTQCQKKRNNFFITEGLTSPKETIMDVPIPFITCPPTPNNFYGTQTGRTKNELVTRKEFNKNKNFQSHQNAGSTPNLSAWNNELMKEKSRILFKNKNIPFQLLLESQKSDDIQHFDHSAKKESSSSLFMRTLDQHLYLDPFRQKTDENDLVHPEIIRTIDPRIRDSGSLQFNSTSSQFFSTSPTNESPFKSIGHLRTRNNQKYVVQNRKTFIPLIREIKQEKLKQIFEGFQLIQHHSGISLHGYISKISHKPYLKWVLDKYLELQQSFNGQITVERLLEYIYPNIEKYKLQYIVKNYYSSTLRFL